MADIKLCTHCHDSGKNAYFDEDTERYIEETCGMCRGQGYTLLRGFDEQVKKIPMTLDLKRAIERVLANVKAGKRPLA